MLDTAPMLWVELIGYFASAFVAASLLMVSFVRLRVINLIGAVAFVAYALLIGSVPILLTNVFIAGINIFHLVRIFRTDVSGFTYVPIDSSRRHQLADFLELYRDDVVRFYPEFAVRLAESAFDGGGRVYLAMRKLETVGFACSMPLSALREIDDPSLAELRDYLDRELYPEQSVYLPVDYIVKRYRDLGLVHRLHERLVQELGSGAQFAVAIVSAGVARTRRFLERTGYVEARTSGDWVLYVKSIG
jgi:hypothetical protein